ncbi:type IX secretion system membrane protein PorP/SprF [Tenacibaculum finnmarkense]|uniref:PorP/SprF family type IX secretion system membrane protein n=1 Tax=Tenacibaculum finnmarkense TaxID=2781243 RepID=UPI001E30FFD6|nr:type IX secretion system membrane protein PorP/SprF [Tenacibaculum finnmarkense]MCD8422822.1 type IX secretion system membrane protein PorP/SprF [Tenacibaculum finnmarkense genomovar ulcerans]MCD8443903.1 type IX secretion system membrane protein PorP/SprF [Tenacibaculum finnmarkense genomovar ulcerans]MCG8749857.1 type IX secretion system membrane protein PorP/SprF [Tenacibaculum finnmarkense]MCG8755082.1 type IX secretion system membrane protein PorP/SprF [Tenacibaculum finnmarkense]MCG87
MNKIIIFCFFIFIAKTYSQETLPIYTDYLSDNIYLLHPTAAGIGSCSKLRVTARQQWIGIKNAPSLQTASFHAKFNENSKAGYGVILFNDKNGYHSQTGLQGTYAYHLDMGNENTFQQLSFGLSMSMVQNSVDQQLFKNDPMVSQIINSDFYFNADVGMAYHYKGFSSYLTIKNMMLSSKNNVNTNLESLNLRNYILGVGYFFGDKNQLEFEPSAMFQYKKQTGDKIVDLNVKVYKKMSSTHQLWAALSYRKSFDSSVFGDANYLTPIIGLNYKNLIFAYTYTKQTGDAVFSNGNFHQISFGIDILCRKRRASACPNISGLF